ncbi:hypothetical protein [Afipia felis]|uniref:Uncharacterized protein n=2 Tax=Afipia felis TaxID=1035 RepID=A0A380WAL9_AFIFE|nr:hypothetical protein [Afipia felis]EKS29265.1 hypothetical protein HMPREF9697_01793 [Afipia felis ATCC 53690]SUU77973.1 Uncharacterised protein [Afipia felis]SUU86038.1 Uncharacterised protein [Afipia felis]
MVVLQVTLAAFLILVIAFPLIMSSEIGRKIRLRIFFNGDENAMAKDEWRRS